MKRLIALAAVLLSCQPLPPPLPPPDGPGTCQTAAANLTRLGGCGLDMAAFPAECDGATTAEVEIGVRFPVGCLSGAADCAAARMCR